MDNSQRDRLARVLVRLQGQLERLGRRRGYGEDLYGDVWVECLERVNRYNWQPPEGPKIVWAIATRLAATHLRREQRRPSVIPLDESNEPRYETSHCTDEQERRTEVCRLREIIARLSRRERQVLHDRFWKGMRAVEIAHRDGIRPAAVRLRVMRAKKAVEQGLRRVG